MSLREPLTLERLTNVLTHTSAPCLSVGDRVILPKSKGGGHWEVIFTYTPEHGLLMGCDCPSWRFQKVETSHRVCKHVYEVRNVMTYCARMHHPSGTTIEDLIDPFREPVMAGGSRDECTFRLPDYGDLGI